MEREQLIDAHLRQPYSVADAMSFSPTLSAVGAGTEKKIESGRQWGINRGRREGRSHSIFVGLNPLCNINIIKIPIVKLIWTVLFQHQAQVKESDRRHD
jgi:hypothetical protein